MKRSSPLEKTIRLCYGALFVVTPSLLVLAPRLDAALFGMVTALGLLAVCLVLCSFVYIRGGDLGAAWTPGLLPFLVYPLLLLPAMLFCRAPWHCLFGEYVRFDGMLLVVAQLLVFLGAYLLTREAKDGRQHLFCLLLGSGITALIVLGGGGPEPKLTGGAINPGLYFSLSLALCFGLFQEARCFRHRLWLLMVSLLFMAALLRSGEWLALTGVITAWIWLMRRRTGEENGAARRARNWWILIAVIFLIAMVVYAVVDAPREASALSQSEELMSAFKTRLCVWRGAVEIISHSSLWGHGPGLFRYLFPGSKNAVLCLWREQWAYVPDNACNAFLESAVAFGVIAFLLLPVIFICACRAGRSSASLTAAFAAMLINSLFYSWDLGTALALWSLWGVALNVSRWGKKPAEDFYSIVEVHGARRPSWQSTVPWLFSFALGLVILVWLASLLCAGVYGQAARQRMAAGKGGEAVELGWRALLSQPYLEHLYLQQSEIHVRTGLAGKSGLDADREIELLLRRAREINPLNPNASTRLARFYLNLYRKRGGDWHLINALHQNNLALALAPRDFYLMLERVEMLFISGDLDKVKKACVKIKTLYPRAGEPYGYSAHLAIRAGDYGRAIRDLEKGAGLEWHGNSIGRAKMYSNLAKVYSDFGDQVKAIERARVAVALAPSFLDARYNLGWILLKLGRKEEAVLAWRELLQLNPDHEMTKRGLVKLGER